MTALPDTSRPDLLAAIAVLESQRALLGNAVVDAALAPLRQRVAALAPAAAGAQQVRQVTVLFLDIVGSTTLSQQLDPEETAEVMDGALARFSKVVLAGGGRVLQYAGDNLLAAFGADGAREDDAERGVRAGLALLEAGRDEAAAIARRVHDAAFGVRVGLHTGPVLLGGGVNAEGSIRGLTVNIAARMEQTAPPGGLRISHDTWRQVRGLFALQPQDPIEVKGVDQPMQTYLVQGVLPRAFRVPTRGIDGVEVAMVGRDLELSRLLVAFEVLAYQRRAGAFTLVGDAGLGKSRLLAELRSALDLHPRRPQWLLARAQPNTETQPFGLLRDLLGWHLHIADSDSAEVARTKLVQGLAPYFADAGPRPALLLGQLIGLDVADDPLLADVKGRAEVLRTQAFAAARTLLRRMAATPEQPLVLLAEDLHWADDGSLDFLEALMAGGDDDPAPPLLLVQTARPGLNERRAEWGARSGSHQRLDLAPLDAADSQALGHTLLGRLTGEAEAVQAVRQLVVGDAEGNPFYMEELIKMLVDDGVITTGPSLWEVHAERLAKAQVPRTLTGVLQARLDALQPTQRQAAQMAAVLGHVFWDQALEALMPGGAAHLPALVKKQLVVRRDRSVFNGAVEYSFHHHLLHQVTYETLLKGPRRAAHAAAAAWWVERVGDRDGESLAVAGDHYEHAGDHARALDCFDRATQAALARSAQMAVLAHTARALANPALTDVKRRLKLLRNRLFAADWLGRRDVQRAGLADVEALVGHLDDPGERADLLISQSMLADRLGEAVAADRFAREAVVLAEAGGSARPAALSLGMIAWGHFLRQEFEPAAAFVARAMIWAERCEEPIYPVQMRLLSAHIAVKTADFDLARGWIAEARDRARTLKSNERLLGTALHLEAQVAFASNDFEQALVHARAASEQGHQHGIGMSEANGLLLQCESSHELGDLDAAERLGQEALALYLRVGGARFEAKALQALGLTRLRAGRQAEALADLSRAVDLFRQHGMPADSAEAVAWLAWSRWLCGLAEQARADIEDLLAKGLPPVPAINVLFNVHRVLQALGDSRAATYLAAAHERLQQLAEHIADPVERDRWLHGSDLHRALVAAWADAPP